MSKPSGVLLSPPHDDDEEEEDGPDGSQGRLAQPEALSRSRRRRPTSDELDIVSPASKRRRRRSPESSPTKRLEVDSDDSGDRQRRSRKDKKRSSRRNREDRRGNEDSPPPAVVPSPSAVAAPRPAVIGEPLSDPFAIVDSLDGAGHTAHTDVQPPPPRAIGSPARLPMSSLSTSMEYVVIPRPILPSERGDSATMDTAHHHRDSVGAVGCVNGGSVPPQSPSASKQASQQRHTSQPQTVTGPPPQPPTVSTVHPQTPHSSTVQPHQSHYKSSPTKPPTAGPDGHQHSPQQPLTHQHHYFPDVVSHNGTPHDAASPHRGFETAVTVVGPSAPAHHHVERDVTHHRLDDSDDDDEDDSDRDEDGGLVEEPVPRVGGPEGITHHRRPVYKNRRFGISTASVVGRLVAMLNLTFLSFFPLSPSFAHIILFVISLVLVIGAAGMMLLTSSVRLRATMGTVLDTLTYTWFGVVVLFLAYVAPTPWTMPVVSTMSSKGATNAWTSGWAEMDATWITSPSVNTTTSQALASSWYCYMSPFVSSFAPVAWSPPFPTQGLQGSLYDDSLTRTKELWSGLANQMIVPLRMLGPNGATSSNVSLNFKALQATGGTTGGYVFDDIRPRLTLAVYKVTSVHVFYIFAARVIPLVCVVIAMVHCLIVLFHWTATVDLVAVLISLSWVIMAAWALVHRTLQLRRSAIRTKRREAKRKKDQAAAEQAAARERALLETLRNHDSSDDEAGKPPRPGRVRSASKVSDATGPIPNAVLSPMSTALAPEGTREGDDGLDHGKSIGALLTKPTSLLMSTDALLRRGALLPLPRGPIDVPLMLLDCNGVVVHVNNAFLLMAHVDSPYVFLGRSLASLLEWLKVAFIQDVINVLESVIHHHNNAPSLTGGSSQGPTPRDPNDMDNSTTFAATAVYEIPDSQKIAGLGQTEGAGGTGPINVGAKRNATSNGSASSLLAPPRVTSVFVRSMGPEGADASTMLLNRTKDPTVQGPGPSSVRGRTPSAIHETAGKFATVLEIFPIHMLGATTPDTPPPLSITETLEQPAFIETVPSKLMVCESATDLLDPSKDKDGSAPFMLHSRPLTAAFAVQVPIPNAICDVMPTPLCLFLPDGCVVSWNAALSALLDISSFDMLGMNIYATLLGTAEKPMMQPMTFPFAGEFKLAAAMKPTMGPYGATPQVRTDREFSYVLMEWPSYLSFQRGLVSPEEAAAVKTGPHPIICLVEKASIRSVNRGALGQGGATFFLHTMGKVLEDFNRASDDPRVTKLDRMQRFCDAVFELVMRVNSQKPSMDTNTTSSSGMEGRTTPAPAPGDAPLDPDAMHAWARLVSQDASICPTCYLTTAAGKEFKAGRSAQCQVTIRDAFVSSVQFTITRRANSREPVVQLTDVSANGTFVNVKRVGKGRNVTLKHNDLITFRLSNGQFFLGFVFQMTQGGKPTALPGLPGGAGTAAAATGGKLLRQNVDWRIGEELLGKGGNAEVFLGINLQNGKLIAVKRVAIPKDERTKQQYESLQDEIQLLSTATHPNIVQYYGTSQSASHLHILLEFVPGGSIRHLLDNFGQLSDNVIVRYLRQILLGLTYLHERGIVHGDLKCANVLVTDKGEVKITDFGTAKLLAHEDTVKAAEEKAKKEAGARGDKPVDDKIRFRGTLLWMAPEVVQGLTESTAASDMWAVGCCLLEMLTARCPWAEYDFENQQQIVNLLSYTTEVPEIPASASPMLSTIAKECLQRDVSKRPDCQSLLHYLGVTSEDHPTTAHRRGGNGGAGDYGGGGALPRGADLMKEIAKARALVSDD